MTWNPGQYARFADHRERPFHDLVARIGAEAPALVFDVGCGPGTATATLAGRWPGAGVMGYDSSEAMVDAAQPLTTERLHFELADAHELEVGRADVLISNAMLQWLPDHRELVRAWADALRPGAWMAFQVPGNFDAPSHALMRALAESPRWAPQLAGVLRGGETVDTPVGYAELLLEAGWSVDAWETTYIQWLSGEDPVLEWVRGTGLRPVLNALNEADTAEFEAEYASMLRAAYPSRRGPDGQQLTALPFRRIFVVGNKPQA